MRSAEPEALADGGVTGASPLRGEVLRVDGDAAEVGRRVVVLPEQADEREPGNLADAPDVPRDAELVEDRQVEPAVVRRVAGRPQDGRDALAREVELGDLGWLDTSATRRSSSVTSIAGSLGKGVAQRPEPVVEELVRELEVVGEVRRRTSRARHRRRRTGRRAGCRRAPSAAGSCRGRRDDRRRAGCRRTEARLGELVDGRERRLEVRSARDELPDPPEDVVPAIAPAAPDRNRPTDRVTSRPASWSSSASWTPVCPEPDDQDPARRQLRRVPVVVRMELRRPAATARRPRPGSSAGGTRRSRRSRRRRRSVHSSSRGGTDDRIGPSMRQPRRPRSPDGPGRRSPPRTAASARQRRLAA